MKIKLDENLPRRLVRFLNDLGQDTDTVFDERLTGQDDEVVWKAAQTTGRFLITQDLDFSDARSTSRANTTDYFWSDSLNRAVRPCSSVSRRSSEPRTLKTG